MDLRQEGGARALERLERLRAREIRRPRQATRTHEPERQEGSHELRAVDERQALLRLEARRLEPDARERLEPGEPLAVDERLPLADERQRQMRQRCEVSGGADRAAARDDRQDASLEAVEQ